MQFRYGITASLTALLVMVILLSQGSAYLTTSEQLRQTVREREIDKVKTLGNIIEQLLQRETTRTRELAKLLASNPTLATAATGNVASREQLLDDTLKQLFSGRQIDLLEITDASETIVYRAGSNAAVGERSAVWGVTEALTGASGIATTIEAKGVTVRAIEPLRQNGRITGTLMTGIYMNSNYLANLSRQIGANLVLVSRSKPVATSAPGMLESLDATAIREAFDALPYKPRAKRKTPFACWTCTRTRRSDPHRKSGKSAEHDSLPPRRFGQAHRSQRKRWTTCRPKNCGTTKPRSAKNRKRVKATESTHP